MISREPVPTTLEASAFTVSDWVLSRVTEGRYFGEGCGEGGEKEEEQWKTDRKRGPEKSSKHEMSVYQ